MQFDSPGSPLVGILKFIIVHKGEMLCTFTAVSRGTCVILFMSFMYQDIYRSLDEFALKINEENREFKRGSKFVPFHVRLQTIKIRKKSQNLIVTNTASRK